VVVDGEAVEQSSAFVHEGSNISFVVDDAPCELATGTTNGADASVVLRVSGKEQIAVSRQPAPFNTVTLIGRLMTAEWKTTLIGRVGGSSSAAWQQQFERIQRRSTQEAAAARGNQCLYLTSGRDGLVAIEVPARPQPAAG
jgi:hypothetical protein